MVSKAFSHSLCVVFVLAALTAVPMHAAVLVHLSFDEMAEKSSAIFLGRCIEVRSAWAGADIVTHNVFEVGEYFKGDLGQRVTVTEIGGQVGNIVAAYPGLPRFKAGEEAVLFVWTDPLGVHQVIGLTQGRFRINRAARSGDVSLLQSSSDEPMVEPSGHAHSGAVEPLSFALPAFRSRLSLAAQRRARRVQQ
jgi:hypothetical protein